MGTLLEFLEVLLEAQDVLVLILVGVDFARRLDPDLREQHKQILPIFSQRLPPNFHHLLFLLLCYGLLKEI
jgi:hypothetical protein